MVSRSASGAPRRGRQRRLPRGDIHRVVMQRVQRRRGGDGTQAVLAPACGWPIFCFSMSAIRSGAAHMPLPICALPRRPHCSPISTFWSSYALIHAASRMSFLRIIGPASIEVWISSPVRSRKPVLMNATRSFAAAMQALRLAEVRRSSSMMPIFSVLGARPSISSTRPNRRVGERHLLRTVHLRLDDVDRAGTRVAQLPCAAQVVHARSAR